MIEFNIDNYLRISLTDVILVCISTALIIFFAKHFFWDKLMELVKKRQDFVQGNIDASVQLKEEAQKTKDQYDEKMKSAGMEAHQILESARAHAGEEKDKILKDAQAQAVRLKEQASEEIERDKRKAEKEMKTAISEVAIAAARELVQKEMDETVQKQFVDEFIDQAGDKKW